MEMLKGKFSHAFAFSDLKNEFSDDVVHLKIVMEKLFTIILLEKLFVQAAKNNVKFINFKLIEFFNPI